jgi:hypothetical protein
LTRLRFSLAQQVLDSVPDLGKMVPAGDLDPLAYVSKLVAGGAADQAVAFCAFLLPRREAVQWLCQSVRSSGVGLPPGDEHFLKLAEGWVKTPTESARRAAGEAADHGDKTRVAVWAAQAAGWSGGNMTKDQDHPIPPPAHLTGVAVKVGLHLLSLAASPENRGKLMEDTVKGAVMMLNQDKA